MNPISAQNWIAMSSLIDDAMELPLSERDEWLQRLTIERPEMATAVRSFLQAQAQLEAHDLLERGPHLRNVVELGDEVSDTFQEGDGIGPYRLLQPLGRGGMAVVWLAERTDASPARRVALKVPQLSVWRFDFAARFARERDILASLEHPNIARLYDAGLSTMDGPGNGRPYLAMEYVEGQGLTKYCDEHTLDIPARIQLFMQVLDAVQYAHARLVIHRDLKPSNILVTDEGQVRLLDFGVAKLLEADRAAEPAPALEAAIATRAAFTPEYASPEQVRGAVLGTASDVYSLGVVLYELLCGQRPYRLRHATSAQLELAILDAESDAPSSRIDANGASRYGSTERKIRRQLRGDLDTIVLKALKKQTSQRYASVATLIEDLRRWRDGEPVLARRDSLGYRVNRFVQKHWKPLMAASVAVCLLLATTVVAVYQAQQAKLNSQAAQEEAKKAVAVKDFLKDLFKNNSQRQNDPEAGRHRTAEQLLSEGAARIKTGLLQAPVERMELMLTVSDIYRDLNIPGLSLELIEQRAQLGGELYGKGSLKHITMLADWLNTASALEDPSVGARALIATQPYLASLATVQDLPSLRVEAMIYEALLQHVARDDRQEGPRLVREANKVFQRLPPDEFKEERHLLLGAVQMQHRMLMEAMPNLIEANRLLDLQPPEEVYTHDSHRAWLARAQMLAGQTDQAQSMFKRAFAMERHSDSTDLTPRDGVLRMYAEFQANTARLPQAIEMLRYGGTVPGSPLSQALEKSAAALQALGGHLVTWGSVEAGIAAADRSEKIDPDWKIHTLSIKSLAAIELGRFDEVDANLAQANTELLKTGSGRTIFALIYLSALPRQHLAMHRTADARAVFEQSRKLLAPTGSGLASQSYVDVFDAIITDAERRPAKAINILERALARIVASPDRVYLIEHEGRALEALGSIRQELGDAKAVVDLVAALAIYEKVYDTKTSLRIARVAAKLATLQRLTGHIAEARRAQTQSDAILRQHPGFRGWAPI